MENQEEVWMPVVGYEKYYKVSNTGKVKRFNYDSYGVNTKHKSKDYCLKPLDNGCGYLRIKFSVKNKAKRIMLHRIIAEAFIPNPQKKKTVNHKDGNKYNNSIDNLEWLTQAENNQHAWDTGLKRKARTKKN